MNTLKSKITSQLSNMWNKSKIAIATILVALMPILNSWCGPEQEAEQKKQQERCDSTISKARQKKEAEEELLSSQRHYIKFVVFYTDEIKDTLSYTSEDKIYHYTIGWWNFIETRYGRWNGFQPKEIFFRTTAPIKVLENR